MINAEKLPGISLVGMSKAEWTARRVHSIGGSEIGVIMGFNNYKTPLQLYREKTGEAVPDDISSKETVYWGTMLEDIVAQEFAKRANKKVAVLQQIFIHPQYDFMTANIDRDVLGEDAGLECKTASEYKKGEWQGEEIPASYILQCQWYMAITGARQWYIACLIGGNKFDWKPVPRDDELIGMMEHSAVSFWKNHVLKRIPPKATAGDFFEVTGQDEYILPDDADTLIREFITAKDMKDEADNRKRTLEAQIKQLLDGRQKGRTGKFTVNHVQFESSVFEEAKFKAENPQLAEQYCKKQLKEGGLRIKELIAKDPKAAKGKKDSQTLVRKTA